MPEIITTHLLSIVTFLPLVGAILLMLFFPRPPDEADSHGGAHGADEGAESHDAPAKNSSPATLVRGFTLLVTLLTLGFSLLLLRNFNPGERSFQFVEGPYTWIGQFGVKYHMGIDGISLL